ncbi:hypothetical protein GCM10011428_18740 [Streptomyces violaceus]
MKSGLSTGATRLFVYGTFDKPVTEGSSSGVKGHLRFKTDDRTVTLRLATSLISVDQAKDNLRQEIPDGTSFEAVKRSAQRQWDRLLGKVEVEGATPDQLTTLYSSLYRLYLYPNSGFEKAGGKHQYASPFSPMPNPDTRRTPARRSSTARCTSTTASGTPTGRPGRPTPSSRRAGRASWSTGSCSSTRTAAGPHAGPLFTALGGLTAVGGDTWRWPALLLTWAAFGALSSMVLTPTGRLIRRSTPPEARTAAFAAQFSLSHSCWLLTYPLAGWLGAGAGLQSAVAALGLITLTAGLAAVRLWPAQEPGPVEHEHSDLHADHPHLVDAIRIRGAWRHSHHPLTDGLHAHR